MIVYQDYLTFIILNEEIHLISDETAYGRNTVAEINDCFHYMWNEPLNIATAIFAWQEVNGRDLTNEELRQIMQENDFISDAI